jgi:mannose-6-phosphate isomerase-like protein (cupin superfamily)
MKHKISLAEAKEKLQMEAELPFTVLMKHGTMSVEYFAPKITDTQQPHSQDEIYVIASGKSSFICGVEYFNCEKGDVLFVPAGMEHYFENFNDDFATWVIFYGADGGVNNL